MFNVKLYINLEMTNFGEVDDLIVCNNLGEHIMGNVYAKFKHEDDAEKAL
jgi:splicing factor U2AF subunit